MIRQSRVSEQFRRSHHLLRPGRPVAGPALGVGPAGDERLLMDVIEREPLSWPYKLRPLRLADRRRLAARVRDQIGCARRLRPAQCALRTE